jgi:hypothetical protein
LPATRTAASRIGANNLGVAVNAAKVLDIGTTYVALPASYYFNFGSTTGTSGYGIRDNAGTIEIKNSGGSWAAPGGGSGSPGGSNTQLQYNNSGAFGGTAALTYATSGALLTMTAQAATDKPLIVKAAAAQSADLTQWQDSSATVLALITAAGRLQGADGTVSLPAFAFTSDTDCGLYRIGANNIGVAVGGAKAIDIATTAVGLPASYYLNFGSTLGTSGYGIRDNGGTMEFKNSGGTWAGLGSGGGGSGLPASDGTVSAPGIAFSSDSDSGIYRIGANNIGVAVNGAKELDIATTGLTLTHALTLPGDPSSALQAAIKQYVDNFSGMPISVIGKGTNIDLNATGDNAISIVLPRGATKWRVQCRRYRRRHPECLGLQCLGAEHREDGVFPGLDRAGLGGGSRCLPLRQSGHVTKPTGSLFP